MDGRDYDFVSVTPRAFRNGCQHLSKEIVGLKPEVIVAAAVNAAGPAHAATSVIPIVCPALADAVHLGLIASEARPGGNVTGIEPYVAGSPAKQIEFARGIAPGATQIGAAPLIFGIRKPRRSGKSLVSAAEALKLTVAETDRSDWILRRRA